MQELKGSELKTWRKKFKLSQKKLADMANISLATMRQIEIGKSKPQSRTMQRLINAVKDVESAPAAAAPKKAAAPVPKAAVKVAKGGAKPVHRAKVGAAAKPAARGRPRVTAKPARAKVARKAPAASGPIKMTNLDLELINRILNMSGKDKLQLLRKLM